MKLRVDMPADEARACGVEVLREEDGVMHVGTFTIPVLNRSVLTQLPKSESLSSEC